MSGATLQLAPSQAILAFSYELSAMSIQFLGFIYILISFRSAII